MDLQQARAQVLLLKEQLKLVNAPFPDANSRLMPPIFPTVSLSEINANAT